MSGTVVRFPYRRLARRSIGELCELDPERSEIDQALRSVELALKSLQRQRQSLLMRYRAVIDRIVAQRDETRV